MSKRIEKLFSKKYLFWTNVSIGVTFHTLGDAVSQNLEMSRNANQSISYRRLFSMAIGGAFYGTCGHHVYGYIDRKYPGRSLATIKNKLIIDAMACPPIALFGTAIVGAAEGKSVDQIWHNIQTNVLYIIAFDTFCYLPFQVMNFRYINPRFRYVFVASTSLLYTTYLSFILHRNQTLYKDISR